MAFPGYPDPIDVVALQVGVQEIAASAASAAVGARTSDAITSSTGWSVVGAGDGVAKTGQTASLEGTIQRTGGNLTVTSSWTKFAAIPVGYRPGFEQIRQAQTNSGLSFQFRIATNGDVSVRSSTGNQTWPTTGTFAMSGIGTWAVAA